MKKLLWISGTFFAGTLFQLICTLVFLFLDNDPITNTVILAALLLATSVCVVLQDAMLKGLVAQNQLDDDLLGKAVSMQRLVRTLLGLETANVLLWAVSAVFELPFWVYLVLALTFVAACIISVCLLLVALKPGRDQQTDEQEEA